MQKRLVDGGFLVYFGGRKIDKFVNMIKPLTKMKTNSIFISLILFLFLPEFSNCQIEFYDYSPDTVITVYGNEVYGTEYADDAYFLIDLNGDSIDDIRFRLFYGYRYDPPRYEYRTYVVTVKSINEKNSFGVVEPPMPFLKGFSSGDTIDNNIIWGNYSSNYLTVSSDSYHYYYSEFFRISLSSLYRYN